MRFFVFRYFRYPGKRGKTVSESRTELFIHKQKLTSHKVQDTIVTVRAKRDLDGWLEFRGSAEELREALRLDDGFRFLSAAETESHTVRTEHGTLLLHPSARAAVYVKGMLVCREDQEYTKLLYGYDLPKLKLSVDRSRVNCKDTLRDCVQGVWRVAIEAQPERLAPLFLDMMLPCAQTAQTVRAAGDQRVRSCEQGADAEESEHDAASAALKAPLKLLLHEVTWYYEPPVGVSACTAVAQVFTKRFGDAFAISASASAEDRRFVARQLKRRMVHVAGPLEGVLETAGALKSVRALREKVLRDMKAAPPPTLEPADFKQLQKLHHVAANRLLLKPEEVRLVDIDDRCGCSTARRSGSLSQS